MKQDTLTKNKRDMRRCYIIMMLNLLMVVGISAMIAPIVTDKEVLKRDHVRAFAKQLAALTLVAKSLNIRTLAKPRDPLRAKLLAKNRERRAKVTAKLNPSRRADSHARAFGDCVRHHVKPLAKLELVHVLHGQ